MIFAFLFTALIGLCGVALIGLQDSHQQFMRLLEELDQQAAKQSEEQAGSNAVRPIHTLQLVTDKSGRPLVHSLSSRPK